MFVVVFDGTSCCFYCCCCCFGPNYFGSTLFCHLVPINVILLCSGLNDCICQLARVEATNHCGYHCSSYPLWLGRGSSCSVWLGKGSSCSVWLGKGSSYSLWLGRGSSCSVWLGKGSSCSVWLGRGSSYSVWQDGLPIQCG